MQVVLDSFPPLDCQIKDFMTFNTCYLIQCFLHTLESSFRLYLWQLLSLLHFSNSSWLRFVKQLIEELVGHSLTMCVFMSLSSVGHKKSWPAHTLK